MTKPLTANNVQEVGERRSSDPKLSGRLGEPGDLLAVDRRFYNSRGVHLRGEGGDQERELAVKYRKWAQETAPDYSFVSSVLASLASSYERDAEREDSEDRMNRRLRH